MKKKVLAFFMAIAMLTGLCMTFASAEDAEMPFTDVAENDWFYSYVKYVYDNGIMNGVDNDKFGPDSTMNRAMFVTILGRIEGAEQKEDSTFPDLENNSWYSGYVGWAAENKIFGGYPDGTFHPDDPITRQEMAVAMARYINYKEVHLLHATDASKSFGDAETIADWSQNEVEIMRQSGLLRGNDNGDFQPEKGLTRAEAAAFIQRMRDMLLYLRIEDPITPSYIVEGKDFALLGAYQLYYAGSALTTSYKATQVKDGTIPTLAGSTTGRKVTHFYENPENTIAKGTYFGIDMKIICVDPDEYPVVRIGYKTSDNSDATLGVYSGSASKESVSATNASETDGLRSLTADLTGSGAWEANSQQIVLTLMAGEKVDLEIAYVAMFKSTAAAAAFSLSDYADSLKSYSGAAISYEQITDATLKSYMDQVDNRIDEIVNYDVDIDPETITGTVYYVSSVNGNDSNDGSSPDKAWKSLSSLYYNKGPVTLCHAQAGDAVLFERGSKFYSWIHSNNGGDSCLNLEDGVTYGAYGKGAKPIFTTSVEFTNGSSTGSWSKVDGTTNVYVLDQVLEKPEGSGIRYNDIANIVFDGGKNWGIKVVVPYEDPIGKKTENCGMVTNGTYSYPEGGITFEGPQSLVNDLEFWIDYNTNKVYLCSVDGAPDVRFREIMITKKGSGFSGTGKNITIDNIAFIGSGSFGISTNNVENLTVQNCQIEWTGGAFQENTGGTRFGNAIQNWNNCDGFYVLNCYINEAYDAGITPQGSGAMINCEFSGNVFEKCNMQVELFNHNDHIQECYTENLIVRDNYERYAGYGFGHQRPVSNKTGTFMLGAKNWETPATNVVIENNINLYSVFFAFGTNGVARGDHAEGVIFRNNVYLMSAERGYICRSANNLIDQTGGDGKAFYPYTEQYVQYFADLGIELGSKFYFYNGYVFEAEKDGVYYDSQSEV